MIPRPRKFPLVCLLSLAPWAFAQPSIDAVPSSLSPELASLLAAQPRWSFSAEVQTSFGYKDNLVLSSHDEERSAFARGSVDLLLLHVPRGRIDYSLFAQAEGTRFFSGEAVDHEAQLWLQSDLGYRPGKSLKLGFPVTAYYYDQVFDVSDTDIERVVAELRVGGVMAGPTLRWAFHRWGWVELQATAERKRYEDHANDSRVGEASVRFGWRFGRHLETRLAGYERVRDFDQRVQYTSAGRPLEDTKLKITEREAELATDVEWDENRKWKSTTRLGLVQYRDNGFGYFDYDEKRFIQEVSWRPDGWLMRLRGSAGRIDFRVQTVGIGIEPPARIKDEFMAELRVERKLSARWTLVANYSWERSRSNDQIASYRVNEGLLGARWSWDK